MVLVQMALYSVNVYSLIHQIFMGAQHMPGTMHVDPGVGQRTKETEG